MLSSLMNVSLCVAPRVVPSSSLPLLKCSWTSSFACTYHSVCVCACVCACMHACVRDEHEQWICYVFFSFFKLFLLLCSLLHYFVSVVCRKPSGYERRVNQTKLSFNGKQKILFCFFWSTDTFWCKEFHWCFVYSLFFWSEGVFFILLIFFSLI